MPVIARLAGRARRRRAGRARRPGAARLRAADPAVRAARCTWSARTRDARSGRRWPSRGWPRSAWPRPPGPPPRAPARPTAPPAHARCGCGCGASPARPARDRGRAGRGGRPERGRAGRRHARSIPAATWYPAATRHPRREPAGPASRAGRSTRTSTCSMCDVTDQPTAATGATARGAQRLRRSHLAGRRHLPQRRPGAAGRPEPAPPRTTRPETSSRRSPSPSSTGRLLPAVATPRGGRRRAGRLRPGARHADPARRADAPACATRSSPRRTGPTTNLLPAADVPSRDAVARYLALGEGVPDRAAAARPAARRGQASPYQRALAIEQFLAEHYRLVGRRAERPRVPEPGLLPVRAAQRRRAAGHLGAVRGLVRGARPADGPAHPGRRRVPVRRRRRTEVRGGGRVRLAGGALQRASVGAVRPAAPAQHAAAAGRGGLQAQAGAVHAAAVRGAATVAVAHRHPRRRARRPVPARATRTTYARCWPVARPPPGSCSLVGTRAWCRSCAGRSGGAGCTRATRATGWLVPGWS